MVNEELEEEMDKIIPKPDLTAKIEPEQKEAIEKTVKEIRAAQTFQELFRANEKLNTQSETLQNHVSSLVQKNVILTKGESGNPNELGTDEYLRICDSKKILRSPIDKLVDAFEERIELLGTAISILATLVGALEEQNRKSMEKLIDSQRADKRIARLEAEKGLSKEKFDETSALLEDQFVKTSGVYGDVIKEQRQLVEKLIEMVGASKISEPTKQDYIKPEEKLQKSERFDEALEWIREIFRKEGIPKMGWGRRIVQMKDNYGITHEEAQEIHKIIQEEQPQREDSSIK